jgi:mannosyl-oligosaccharide alpha-1,2-mannosidase
MEKYGPASKIADEVIADIHLPPGYVEIHAPYYILRPDAIESIFILYRIAADSSLMDRAWGLWTAIHQAIRTNLAYNALLDVNPKPR